MGYKCLARKLSQRRGVIHVNIHNYCSQSNMYVYFQTPLETVRLSFLLSAGAVVISEITNEKDMKAFDGLVLFEPSLSGARGYLLVVQY